MRAKGSELKRVKQSRKANSRNRHYKSKMNTSIKNFLTLNKKEDNIRIIIFKKIILLYKKAFLHIILSPQPLTLQILT